MTAQLEKKGRVPYWTALMAAAAMALTLGCEKPDWENPDYVAQMLEEGDNRQKREAVGTLRNFPEDRRHEIAEPLAKIYLEDVELRDDVMRHLMQWREPGAVSAYLEEMKTDQTGNAEHAGEVLGRIQSRESIPAMLEAFGSTGNDERRDGILRGLAEMPDPSVVDVAIEVLALDVDNHKISMHSHACNMVGELALEHPDAINEDLKRALIRSVFLSDEVGRQIFRECRLAIQKVGTPMTPFLIELFNQENEEVERLLMTYEQSTEGYQYPFNRAKQEAALQLTGMRAPEAVELFLEDMAVTKEVPDGYSQNRRVSWIRMEGASLNEMILGLGDLGDPAARPMLERVLEGDLIGNEWDNITDDMVDFQFRQDAARALTRLGDRDARAKLLKMAQADTIGVMARRFAAEAARAEENPDAPVTPEVEQFRPQWQAAAGFAFLAEADDRERYESFVSGVDDGEFKEKLESFLPAFDVMDKCGDTEEAAAKATCFGEFIDADEEGARFKAAYELSRLPGEAAAPVVAEAIKTDSLSTREVLTFAGYRAPSSELVASIDEILQSEGSRSASEYRRDRDRLHMLRAWLQHHDSDPVVAAAEE